MPIAKRLIERGIIRTGRRKKRKKVLRKNPKKYREQRRLNFLAKSRRVLKGVLPPEKSRQWNSGANLIEKLGRHGKINYDEMRKLYNALDAIVLGERLLYADKKRAIKYGLPVKI